MQLYYVVFYITYCFVKLMLHCRLGFLKINYLRLMRLKVKEVIRMFFFIFVDLFTVFIFCNVTKDTTNRL